MPFLAVTGCTNDHVGNNSIEVDFSNLSADGNPAETTRTLTLTFSRNITNLGINDIALSGSGIGQIEKTSFANTGTGVYTFGIRGITASGSLTVAVSKQRFNIDPPSRDVDVYFWESSGIPDGERAFIDFSGYSGAATLATNQPSQATAGDFTLENGITGSGLRVSRIGDQNAPVYMERFGQDMGMAARSGNYLVFYIDNTDVKDADTLTMRVTFFDDTYGNLSVHYVTGTTLQERFTSLSIPKGGSKTFVTAMVQLNNCDFNIATQNQMAQFRFDLGAIIQRVELIVGALPDHIVGDPPVFAGQSDVNNISGKAIGGLMAWHNTNTWREWSSTLNTVPSPGNVNVDMWPVGMEDYLANGATLYDTGFTMPDGSTPQLFNSYESEHILTHYQWMAEAGIDGSAIQIFYRRIPAPVDTGTAANQYTRHRDAAEATGRFFFIMYDMTDAASVNQSVIARNMQIDWMYNIENKGVVSSPNYAHADGKPVVSIWGLNSVTGNRYASVDVMIEMIQWFRNRGYYVLGGTPDDRFWETGSNRDPRGREMYRLLDGISPWYGGRDVAVNILGNQWLLLGMEFCQTYPRSWAGNKPIDFFPAIWPGFSWTNMGARNGRPNVWPRDAGQFAWYQVREYLNRDFNHNITGLYLIMFDEYGESTVWMKAATDFFDVPLGQYFVTHAADGTWLSSDYYMRLAHTLVQSFKSRGPGAVDIGPLNQYDNGSSSIVPHSLGPVFWRNSFERRNGRLRPGEGAFVPVPHLQIDVGIPHGEVLDTQNVTVNEPFTVNRPPVSINATSDNYNPPSTTLGMVYTSDGYSSKSGDSAFRLAGTKNTGSSALYRYQIAETRIKIEPGMSLSYWINAVDLGLNVMVDLELDDGTYISNATGPSGSGWQQKTLSIPNSLEGRYITAVIIAYRDSGTETGSFEALIDDIIIAK